MSLAGALPACRGTGRVELTVFAATSLTDAFDAVATAFERQHPGVDVVTAFAGSQELAAQLLAGAGADVFASADEVQMGRVVDAGLVAAPPRRFAGNRLVIAVPAGNPDGVDSLRDLARPDLDVVLAAPEVPVGRYTRAALGAAGVDVDPVSYELDVRAVLTKVQLGEADAGVVYASDVAAAADEVDAVEAEGLDVAVRYVIAPLAAAPQPQLAEEFIALVGSPEGRRLLADAGFVP